MFPGRPARSEVKWGDGLLSKPAPSENSTEMWGGGLVDQLLQDVMCDGWVNVLTNSSRIVAE